MLCEPRGSEFSPDSFTSTQQNRTHTLNIYTRYISTYISLYMDLFHAYFLFDYLYVFLCPVLINPHGMVPPGPGTRCQHQAVQDCFPFVTRTYCKYHRIQDLQRLRPSSTHKHYSGYRPCVGGGRGGEQHWSVGVRAVYIDISLN